MKNRKTLEVNGIDYTFRWCPPGEFEMGSSVLEGHQDDEEQHSVRLTKGFWMLETEVTQEMWESVMRNNPSHFKGAHLPIESVNWKDCKNFIDRLNSGKGLPIGMKFSLPTEAQWEYACRAGTSTPFSFGNVLNGDKANCIGYSPYGTETKGKYLKTTTPVRSYKPNAWGLYDMHGNVGEWCSDRYGDYPSESVTDPTGPNSGSYRVYRGGGWFSGAKGCRSTCRNCNLLEYRSYDLGFRLVLSLTSE